MLKKLTREVASMRDELLKRCPSLLVFSNGVDRCVLKGNNISICLGACTADPHISYMGKPILPGVYAAEANFHLTYPLSEKRNGGVFAQRTIWGESIELFE